MINLNFKKGVVKRGTKVSNEANPQITVLSTYNNFKLNKKARALLDVGEGERVLMLDMMGNGAQAQDERFYLCKADFDVAGVAQGAKLGKGGTYSYSVIYGAIMADDVEITEITPAGLIERELLVETPKGGSYISNQIGVADIERVGDEDEKVEVFEGIEVELFSIGEVKFHDHTPSFRDDGDAEEEVEVDDE